MKRKAPPHESKESQLAEALAFGAELKRHREERGLTREQLAERSGLSPSYIGTIEGGRRNPSLSSIRALAKGLGIAVGELIGPPLVLTSCAMDMARTFEGASEQMKEILLQILRAVVHPPRRRKKETPLRSRSRSRR